MPLARGILVAMHFRLAGRHPLLGRNLPQTPISEDRLVLDARALTFAGPLELAAAVALTHTARAEGRSATLITPVDPNLTAYLQRMDVIRRMPTDTGIEGRLPGEQRADLADSLLEVSPVTPATADDVAARLGRLASAHFGAKTGQVVFAAFGELLDNAIEHGASPAGAFVAAQTYTGTTSGRRGFELAICDTGIGVLSHLRRNPANASLTGAANALERAIRPGVTGTTELRGYGLNDLLSHLTVGGLTRLHLRSGDGLATLTVRRQERVERFWTTTAPVEGTWAWMRVRIP
jgi:hypothetical protein